MSTKKELQDVVKSVAGKAIAEAIEERQAHLAERKHTKGWDKFASKAAGERGGASLAMKMKGQNTSDDSPKSQFGRAVKYLHQANGLAPYAADIADRAGDEQVAKALGESTGPAGGFLVPTELASPVVEELGAKSCVLGNSMVSNAPSKVSVIDLPGFLDMPYIDTSATAAWAGESADVAESEPTFEQISMRPHRLSVVVPASNLFLRSAPAADSLIADHMVRIAQRKLDITLLRSLGASGEPTGLRGHVTSGNTFNSTTTINVKNIMADLSKAIQLIGASNVPMALGEMRWYMSWRSYRAIYQLQGAGTEFPFREEMDQGRLLGIEFCVTSQIPENLSVVGSGDESEIYLAWQPGLMFGLNNDIEVKLFDGGAYGATGSVISGIARDETAFRLNMYCDFAAQYRGNEVALINAVDWDTPA